jgi:hypothetical protein
MQPDTKAYFFVFHVFSLNKTPLFDIIYVRFLMSGLSNRRETITYGLRCWGCDGWVAW